ncbi:NAD(P)-binding domain-containing protein [Desulfocurvibacter africanus]|uniref:6-phosphogluconate dehydrogenase NAD-binding protein n=1 Tax=Desulfocurvibacter africanus subsp. africanus str. Walvis Bay TaxID=690850 RepID=F3YU39_DESAF|nr:NAD(P)-binding domain-containing protein [Desulfocurvibacter africanus]EGJ48645.1 6-phosphogluconate dehydrogenase NAD-binding protein [Desulfocurvibacter africanus subsp. africanus str. Walvis Bay]
MHVAVMTGGLESEDLARRLLKAGHRVLACALDDEALERLAHHGRIERASLESVPAKLSRPRVLWFATTPAREFDAALDKLEGSLAKDDTLVDSGNTFYEDDLCRAKRLERRGAFLLDAGVFKEGYRLSFAVGGDFAAFEFLRPLFESLAFRGGVCHCGGPGAGHFVRSLHERTEHLLRMAYHDARECIEASPYKVDLGFSEFLLFTQRYCKGQPCADLPLEGLAAMAAPSVTSRPD